MIEKLKEELGEVVEHKVLQDINSFHVGGVADYYFVAKTLDQLIAVVLLAQKLKIPYFIMGRGCNILISDFGFPGLWIENRTQNLVVMEDRGQIIVDSGVLLQQIIMAAASHDLTGIESLYGIPGSIGGALYGNAGAQGAEIGSFVKYATLLTTEGKIVRHSQGWFEFGYRTSRLKGQVNSFHKEDGAVLLSICLQLSHNRKEDIMERMSKALTWRKLHQPLGQFSAGSIFKNPAGTMSPSDPQKSAGWMLEQIGAKKIKVGQAAVSKKHANFIINGGKAHATEIRQLIDLLRAKVKEKFGIELEEEIEYVGSWR